MLKIAGLALGGRLVGQADCSHETGWIVKSIREQQAP
jgi:hypothetical protein